MSQRIQVIVAKRTEETSDIISLELRPEDGGSLPPFSGGSHIDVETPSGLVRPYSLCNSPEETHRYVVGILREEHSRGGSDSLHQSAVEGTVLTISAPVNNFPLDSCKRSVLIAGGIGVTPLLAMADELTRAGTDFELHYYARCRDNAALLEWIDQSAYVSSVRLHFDDESGGACSDIRAAFAQVGSDDSREVYICGPHGFLEAVRGIAVEFGVVEERIHYELFSAAANPDLSGDAFEVTLARSGSVYKVPEGKTITEVLAEHGVHIPMSCEEGVCGTCITNVISGEPDHRDSFFSEQEKASGKQVMPCCSRSKSKELVLDL